MIGADERLLTDSDMVELTGVEQPAAQIRVLREHGLSPVIRRDGRPRLTWRAVTEVMLTKPVEQPDWGAIRGRA